MADRIPGEVVDEIERAAQAELQKRTQVEVKKQGWKFGRWLSGRFKGMRGVKEFDENNPKP